MISKEKIQNFRKFIKEGGLNNTTAAKECAQSIEFIYQELFHRDRSKLSPEGIKKAFDAERKMGKGEKGIKGFTMGQLVGLYRNSDFLNEWSKATQTDISAVSVLNMSEINNTRNALIHENIEVTNLDAFFLYSCLNILNNTFGNKKANTLDSLSKSIVKTEVSLDDCINAIVQAMQGLYKRDLLKIEDKKRLKIEEAGFKILEKTGDSQKRIEDLPNDRLIDFINKTNFINTWLKDFQPQPRAIKFIQFDKLFEFANRLASGRTEASPANLYFLYSCCILISETFDIKEQKSFVKKLEKAVKRPRVIPLKKRVAWYGLSILIIAAIVTPIIIYYSFFDIEGFNKTAEKEAAKFYTSVKNAFEKQDPPALYDQNVSPFGYEKDPDVKYSGQFVLGIDRNIFGMMKFSHIHSKDIFIINNDGLSGEKNKTAVLSEPVEILDLSAKIQAERFMNALHNSRSGTYDSKSLPYGFANKPDIDLMGQVKWDKNSISGKISFSHKRSSSIFKLDNDGKIEIVKNNTYKVPETGIEFEWLPGGCFEMGCTGQECFPYEKPVHIACTDGFWMGKYEVTQKQWMSCMPENPSIFKGDDHPVENISWDEVQEYIRILNKKGLGHFRLPTEAEWEYACKYGGTITTPLSANTKSHHPAGQNSPDKCGLYEMSDNVLEWCEDSFSNNAYEEHRLNNPLNQNQGSEKVVRGRSWISPYLPCEHRFKYSHNEQSAEVGFRLVWEPAKDMK